MYTKCQWCALLLMCISAIIYYVALRLLVNKTDFGKSPLQGVLVGVLLAAGSWYAKINVLN